VFSDFEPFWEFVSGPLACRNLVSRRAGQYVRPHGDVPERLQHRAGENLAPCFGLQFFGRVDIDGRSGVMTVTLKDVDNRDLWSVDIPPRPDARPGTMLAQHI